MSDARLLFPPVPTSLCFLSTTEGCKWDNSQVLKDEVLRMSISLLLRASTVVFRPIVHAMLRVTYIVHGTQVHDHLLPVTPRKIVRSCHIQVPKSPFFLAAWGSILCTLGLLVPQLRNSIAI